MRGAQSLILCGFKQYISLNDIRMILYKYELVKRLL